MQLPTQVPPQRPGAMNAPSAPDFLEGLPFGASTLQPQSIAPQPQSRLQQSQPAPAMPSEVDIGNFKSALNEAVMKVTQRPLGAEDIVYTSLLVTMAGGVALYQATVRINAIDGREFEGKPQSLRKAAEQSAAQVALQQLTSALGGKPGSVMPPARGQGTKLPNYKGRLQELLVQDRMKARIFGARAAEYGPIDIKYSSTTMPHPESGGRQGPASTRFNAKVHISGNNFQVEFVGEAYKERKTAEQSAACKALRHFMQELSPDGLGEDILASSLSGMGAALTREDQRPSAKSELNELVMKILSRPAAVQDIQYGLRGSDSSPFKAFVVVPSLAPGKEFEGEAHPQKKQAEQSAAAEALKHFKSLPQVPRPAPSTVPMGLTALGNSDSARLANLRPTQDGIGAGDQAKRDNANHKSALNEFIMKLAGKPLASGDIVYTTRSDTPGLYQATCTIPIMDDMQFQAAPRNRKRDAEQMAAQMALLYYQTKYPNKIGSLTAEGGIQIMAADRADGKESSSNFKSALNELAMRAAGRPLVTGDLNYSVRAIGPGKFQATVKPSVIDAALEFTGDITTRKKDAEQSASAKALEHFSKCAPTVASPLAPRPVGNLASTGLSAFAPTLASTDVGNFKSALNELVMRSCGRPLAKNDISYTPRETQNPGTFIAAVKVLALDPEQSFEGESRTRKKDAQQTAAKAALLHFQSLASKSISAVPLVAPAMAAPSS